MPANHSYEEIRAVACDILAGREETIYPPNQYGQVETGIAEVFSRREQGHQKWCASAFSPAESDLFMEVFWDLFRQGIITLGYNTSNNGFPWCRLCALERCLSRIKAVTSFTMFRPMKS